MTDGDAASPVPLPGHDEPCDPDTNGGQLAEAVPIGSRSGGTRVQVSVATVGAPPWLRVPGEGESDIDDGPPSTRARLSAAPSPTTSRSASASAASASAASRPKRVAPMPRPPVASRPPVARPPVPRPPVSRARPQVVVEDGILGLSRRTRSRVGSRLFTLFFVAVFALIFGQMVFVIVNG